MKKRRTLSGIGMVALFATGGAGNIFTAFVLMNYIINLSLLWQGIQQGNLGVGVGKWLKICRITFWKRCMI